MSGSSLISSHAFLPDGNLWLDVLSKELQERAAQLKHTTIVTTWHEGSTDHQGQWIYFPDPDLDFHRMHLQYTVSDSATGYWTETRLERYTFNDQINHVNEFSYPLNTIEKPQIVKELLSFAAKKNVIGLGRWGEWEQHNSDVCVERAMSLADRMS